MWLTSGGLQELVLISNSGLCVVKCTATNRRNAPWSPQTAPFEFKFWIITKKAVSLSCWVQTFCSWIQCANWRRTVRNWVTSSCRTFCNSFLKWKFSEVYSNPWSCVHALTCYWQVNQGSFYAINCNLNSTFLRQLYDVISIQTSILDSKHNDCFQLLFLNAIKHTGTRLQLSVFGFCEALFFLISGTVLIIRASWLSSET